jgi:hypothetical protein
MDACSERISGRSRVLVARSPATYGTAEDDADLGRCRREEELGALRHQGTQCTAEQDADSTARSPAAQGTTEDDVDLGRRRRREEDLGALSAPWHRTPVVDSDKPDPAHGGGDGNGGATTTPRSFRDHTPRTALPPDHSPPESTGLRRGRDGRPVCARTAARIHMEPPCRPSAGHAVVRVRTPPAA